MQSTETIYEEIPMTLNETMNDQPTNTTICVEKKRKPCEHPWSELVLAVALFVPTNSNAMMDDCKTLIENNKIRLNDSIDLEKYENDMNLEKDKNKINQFISTLYEIKEKMDIWNEPIDCIYVSGKTNKHEEIELLNKNLKKRKDVKSDIYVRFMNGEIIGVSIKNDEKATKSNYSVHKMIDSLENGFNIFIMKYLKDYLRENGIEKVKKTDSKEEKDNKRKCSNKLFYDRNNPYFNILREKIEKYKDEIKTLLVNYLYSSNIHYPVYEFDGKSFVRLNIDKPENVNIDFREYEEYYISKNGKQRNCAKLFYILIVNNKKYRTEIRWKGNCFVSPQFEIHNDE
jgi:hypothetical protein